MASKDEEKVQEKTPGKSKKSLFIIMGVALAAAALAAVGAFMFTGESKGSSQKVEKVSPETLTIFTLEPFIVNIYDGQDLRYLKLRVEMELANAEAKNELTARQAQIRDSILSILTTKTFQDLQYLQGKNQLKQEIMASVTRIVSQGKIKQIYFTDFVVQ
ncbi:MAG TPA: flagellar basal body-associated FliL family protein [Geobacteraceae bacterium]|nr:flagellar basal body-associated FliL family protein [Geobacteraceae bacterium]